MTRELLTRRADVSHRGHGGVSCLATAPGMLKLSVKNLVVWVTFACLIFCPTTLSKSNVKQGSSTTIVYEKYSPFVWKFLLIITIIIMEFLIRVFSWLNW